MTDIIQQHWLVLGAALIILLALGWILFGTRTRRSRVRERRPDVLDEGAAPATRNQALIDSPMAASIVPPMSVDAPAGAGAGVALAARADVIDTGPRADNAEALDWGAAERAEEQAPAGSANGAAPDDLRKLKGVGPKLVGALNTLGITRYEQIANWSEADIDRIDPQLGGFSGRIRRDSWVEQAGLLASGDVAGYESKFGRV